MQESGASQMESLMDVSVDEKFPLLIVAITSTITVPPHIWETMAGLLFRNLK